MFNPAVTVKSTTRSLSMSSGHNSSFMVYHAELVFVKDCSAENHNKNSVSAQRNLHYGLCREHNSLMRAFSHCNKLIWMWGADSGGCIFHIPKDSWWVNPPTRSEMKHFLINYLRPSSCTFSLTHYVYNTPPAHIFTGWWLSQFKCLSARKSVQGWIWSQVDIYHKWWTLFHPYISRTVHIYFLNDDYPGKCIFPGWYPTMVQPFVMGCVPLNLANRFRNIQSSN